jgi:hypothetical protein
VNQLVLGCAAVTSIIAAQAIRDAAVTNRVPGGNPPPLAPSASAAPFVSLGYRELLADLLYARLRTYLGGGDAQAVAAAQLVEAAVALDPAYPRMYNFGVGAIRAAKHGVDNAIYMRMIAVLEKGRVAFPEDWRIPAEIGQIYALDLETKDPAERRAWDERGVRFLEMATRMPHAPAFSAATVAMLRTRLGQQQRARDGLVEMLLISGDTSAREVLLRKLGDLEETDEALLAAEILEERNKFDRAWERERPALPPTMYVILGPKLGGGTFDLGDLALGGRPLIEPPPPPLEPLGP